MVTGRKICKNIKNNENSLQKLEKPMNIFAKTRGGGVKIAVGSEMSLVSGIFMAKRNSCHGNGVKIRHVFGFTFLSRARPPVT
jgi:hypothetical protein